MFGARKHGFRCLATVKLVLNFVGELYTKKNSCGIARFPCDSTAFLLAYIRRTGVSRNRSAVRRITVKKWKALRYLIYPFYTMNVAWQAFVELARRALVKRSSSALHDEAMTGSWVLNEASSWSWLDESLQDEAILVQRFMSAWRALDELARRARSWSLHHRVNVV